MWERRERERKEREGEEGEGEERKKSVGERGGREVHVVEDEQDKGQQCPSPQEHKQTKRQTNRKQKQRRTGEELIQGLCRMCKGLLGGGGTEEI